MDMPLSPETAQTHYHRWLIAKGMAKRTISHYLWHLSLFFTWLKNQRIRSLTRITASHLKAYFSHRYHSLNTKGQPLAIRTRNSDITVIKQFFTILHDQAHIPKNPAQRITAIKKPRLTLPQDILSTAEIKRLLKAPNTATPLGLRDRSILETLIATGMRRQELCNLRLQDVTLSEATLFIQAGKGHKDRVVPLTQASIQYLTRYLKASRPLLQNGWNPATQAPFKNRKKPPISDRLYLSTTGKALTGTTVAETMKKHIQKAKPKSPHIHLHSLRHSIATQLIRHGMPLRHLQTLLGHESLNSTMTYLNLSIQDLMRDYKKAHPCERSP